MARYTPESVGFGIGDEVTLTQKYWVYYQGDCDKNPDVKKLEVGSLGTVVALHLNEGIAEVKWADARYHLNVNLECITVPLSEEDVAEAMRSIAATFAERKS